MGNKKLGFNLRFAVTALLLFGAVAFLNGAANNMKLGRFDLTENGIYTVGGAAKEVLSRLDVPIQIKLYITSREGMPTGLKTLERDLVDKLTEFEVASNGNLTFAVYDPSDDEDLKEKLGAKGVRPFQVQSIEKDAIGVKLVYSSMGIVYKDKDEEMLPQVLPQSLATLEYDICSRVIKLTRDAAPIVAIHASKQVVDPQLMQLYLQMGQQPPPPEDIYGQAGELLKRENYDVRQIELTEASPIPADASTLVLLAPKNLSERQRYEINAFVQRGGNLVVATQNYEYNYNPGQRGGFNISPVALTTGIEELLSNYGLAVSDKLLMDANMEVLNVPSTRNMGGIQIQVAEPVQAPIQIKVSGDQFNSDLSITNQISDLLYLWGSRIEIPESSDGIDVVTLLTTSDQAWESDQTTGPLQNDAFAPNPDFDVSGQPLAVMLTGTLPNAFGQGLIPSWNAAADSVPPSPVESFEPATSKLVLVGCGKMFDDNMIAAANNAMFFLNTIDALTLGDELIEMRSKAFARRTIETQSDGKKLFYRFLAVGFVPLLIAVYGTTRHLRRRSEQARYWAAQSA